MDIPIYTVDAFTRVPFEGNPAAICLVDHEHVIFFRFSTLFQGKYNYGDDYTLK